MRLTLFSAARSASAFGVGGIDRAIAVGVVRVLLGGAGGAALGVGFREDDGQVVVFRGGGYSAKAVGGGADLVLQAHANVSSLAGAGRDEARAALGMEGDEVERNGIAGGGVLVVGAVVEEVGEEGDGALAAGAGAAGAADAGVGQRLADAGDGVVVQLQVIGRRALPVADVGLVPDLEVPGGDFVAAIALDEVLDDAAHQFAPHGVVLGRALHGSFDGVGIGLLVGHGAAGEILGHEAELHHGAHAGALVLVEDLVEDGEVVDGLAAGVEREDIGGGPLEAGLTVARSEQVMGADVDGRGREVVQLGQELAAVLAGGEVDLVVAEPGSDVPVGTERFGQVDLDGNLRRRGRRRACRGLGGRWNRGSKQQGDGKRAHLELASICGMNHRGRVRFATEPSYSEVDGVGISGGQQINGRRCTSS